MCLVQRGDDDRHGSRLTLRRRRHRWQATTPGPEANEQQRERCTLDDGEEEDHGAKCVKAPVGSSAAGRLV